MQILSCTIREAYSLGPHGVIATDTHVDALIDKKRSYIVYKHNMTFVYTELCTAHAAAASRACASGSLTRSCNMTLTISGKPCTYSQDVQISQDVDINKLISVHSKLLVLRT